MKGRKVVYSLVCVAAFLAAYLVLAIGANHWSVPDLNSVIGARPVQAGRSITSPNGAEYLETAYEVPIPVEQVAFDLQRNLGKTFRRQSVDGVHLVVPSTRNGRVKLAELPRYSIWVRAGRATENLNIADRNRWSHVVVSQHIQPNIVEVVWRWLDENIRG